MVAGRGRSWCVGALCGAALACGPGAIVDIGDGDGDSDGSSTSASTTSMTTDTPTPTTSGASADVSSGSAEHSESEDDADTTADGPIIFDVNSNPDAPPAPSCPDGEVNGAMVQGFIWIANSAQGTVSKIDTESMVELGRYVTRPDASGNPSRTSVSRNGDVVVANRSGGVVMIHADTATCPDASNTSSGPLDLVAWPDGCVGWYTPMAYASQRPVAWTAGTFDERSCRYQDADVWTSGANGNIDVLLLDGETGTIETTVPVPGVVASFYGLYGGAVDSQNHFWGSQIGGGHLVRVDRETFEVESWQNPTSSYGMTVDRHDRVWTCSNSVARFDYPTQQWTTAVVNGFGGCTPGLDDILWVGGTPILGIDIETLDVVQMLDVPNYAHGVGFDFAGRVWGVPLENGDAYRIDPATGTVDSVGGLVSPYTYSDMTGTALATVNGQL